MMGQIEEGKNRVEEDENNNEGVSKENEVSISWGTVAHVVYKAGIESTVVPLFYNPLFWDYPWLVPKDNFLC